MIPDRMRVKLKWADVININTSSFPYTYMWRANSVYDPDLTTGISQKGALGSLQYQSFYSMYQVMASKIRIALVNDTTGESIQWALFPTPISPGTYDISSAISQSYSKSCTTSAQGGIDQKTMSCFMTSKKLYGYPKIREIDAQQSNVTGNPGEQWYWVLVGQPQNAAVAMVGQYRVEITYYVEYFQRKNPSLQ